MKKKIVKEIKLVKNRDWEGHYFPVFVLENGDEYHYVIGESGGYLSWEKKKN